jgi:2-isopropylmalate synthase
MGKTISGYEYLVEGKWNYIPYLNAKPVKSKMNLPNKVTIVDLTLREGFQSVNPILYDEKQISVFAQLLADVGIKVIQIKNPCLKILSKLDNIPHIELLIHGRRLLEMGNKWKDAINQIIDNGAWRIKITDERGGGKEMWNRIWGKMTYEENIAKAVEWVEYVKSRGIKVSIDNIDATRMELDFLKELVVSVAEAGCDITRINDSLGIANPTSFKWLVKQVVDAVSKYNIDVGVHCHNDFGLAVANTLAAVEAGANLVDCTIDGIGARAGNARLADVTILLELFYKIKTDLKLEKLYDLTHFLVDMTGGKLVIPKTRPFMGELVFVDPSHSKFIDNPLLFEPIKPEIIGNSSKHDVFTALSNSKSVNVFLKEKGITVNYNQLEKITKQIIDEVNLRKRILKEEEVLSIVKAITQSNN